MFHSTNCSAILIAKAVAIHSFPLTLQSLTSLFQQFLHSTPLQGFFHSHIHITETKRGERDASSDISAVSPFIQLCHNLPMLWMLQPYFLLGYASCKAQHHHFQRRNSQVSVNTFSCLVLHISKSVSEFPIQIFCILLLTSLTPCGTV